MKPLHNSLIINDIKYITLNISNQAIIRPLVLHSIAQITLRTGRCTSGLCVWQSNSSNLISAIRAYESFIAKIKSKPLDCRTNNPDVHSSSLGRDVLHHWCSNYFWDECETIFGLSVRKIKFLKLLHVFYSYIYIYIFNFFYSVQVITFQ